MRKQLLTVLMLLAALPMAHGQRHFESTLQRAEADSPLLQAARSQADAERLLAVAGLLLPNTEAEVATFGGAPDGVGGRIDFSVRQSFALPSVLARRASLRRMRQQAAELDYLSLRSDLLLQVQSACADVVYSKGVLAVYQRRAEVASHLANLYTKRMEQGDCSIIEYNRARMDRTDAVTRQALASAAARQAERELAALVGDTTYRLMQDVYEPCLLPDNLTVWCDSAAARSPRLQALAHEVETHRRQLALTRSEWLPEVSVGYVSETTLGEAYKGVSVGLSLPLWSQQRATRSARLSLTAAQQQELSARTLWCSRALSQCEQVRDLQSSVDTLWQSFRQLQSLQLLDRALEAGEMGLEQYLQHLDYYTAQELHLWDMMLQLEHAYLQLMAVLL